MEDDRLPTELWIRAHLRRLTADAIPAYVMRKGSPMGGTLLLKLNQLDLGCRVLTQARDPDGRLGWLAAKSGAFMPEPDADAYIARAVARDPDLWVVEIEDRQGRHPFEGKVM
ncbi:DUF1491 family protein [Arenibaculum pallidiluteum]|uniref:DUF1491 family protein n=1 Tax=Arenibaculum pallidiluteum TaxID=2812559 RepID=UPI001A9636A7|nr:DUF1491 family protein [Arenibaculum pallidiluteum]